MVVKEILFRDHKWWLDESMETKRVVKSKEDLMKDLNQSRWSFWAEIVDLNFLHKWLDDRINWDTYMVLAKFEWKDNFSPVGYTSWIFPWVEYTKERASSNIGKLFVCDSDGFEYPVSREDIVGAIMKISVDIWSADALWSMWLIANDWSSTAFDWIEDNFGEASMDQLREVYKGMTFSNNKNQINS